MKSAAGYVRCSTDMQEESTAQQKRAIEEYAQVNGFAVSEWFEDEARSGVSFEKRPAFMRMVQAAESAPSFQHILVYDESRWGRPGNPRENTYWRVHFERHGVKVTVIHSQSRNENDIGSFIMEAVEGAEASEYSKKLSRSTKRGCVARATGGYSSGGAAPYGYKRIAVDVHTGKYVRDLTAGMYRRKGEELVSLAPEVREAETVKQMFEWKAQGIGCKTIAERLNEQGIPCARRGKWKSADERWSKGTVDSILQNPAYYGARAYNRFPKNKLTQLRRGMRNPSSAWTVKENAHEPIITKELFDRANGGKALKFAQGSSKIIHSPYLLTGLIKCSHCGHSYSGYSIRKKGLSYYADSGYIYKGKSVCTWHTIPKEKLEQTVLSLIQDNLVDSNVQKDFEEMVTEELRREALEQSGSGGRTKIEREIAEIDRKMGSLLALVESGIDTVTILPRIRELEHQKRILTSELQVLSSSDQKATSAGEEVREFFAQFDEIMRHARLAERKLTIRQCVSRITVLRETEEVEIELLRVPKLVGAKIDALIPEEKRNHRSMCPEQDLNLTAPSINISQKICQFHVPLHNPYFCSKWTAVKFLS
jgi:DNA invertase Pin-like site-specific DNA recombinase